jgi:hypothetical protein
VLDEAQTVKHRLQEPVVVFELREGGAYLEYLYKIQLMTSTVTLDS